MEKPTFSVGVIGTDSILIGARFQPAVYPFALNVPERTRDDKDEVNQGPDPQTSQREDHQDGGPGLLEIKTVGSENPEEKT
jgi:hypothetical protein